MKGEPPPGRADDRRGGPGPSSGTGGLKRRPLQQPVRAAAPSEPDELSLMRELESQNEQLRLAHVALDAARARYQDLYDTAPVALLSVGLQGRILMANQRAMGLLRLGPARPWPKLTDLMRGGTLDAYERERARLLNGSPPATFEVELSRHVDGTVWVQMTMHLAREEADGSLLLQIALTDISQQRRMQEDAARLAAIVASAEQAVLSEDLRGHITSWNAGAERLFGYSSAEAVGNGVEMLIPPEQLTEARSIRSRVRSGATHAHETVRLRRDGSLVAVLVAKAPIFDASGHVVGVSHIAHDITKQIEARQEVQRLLRDMRGADERKDAFIATLAHELRNPLAPIRNAAAVMRFAPDLDPKLQWCRDVIDRQVKHMSALLEDLLDVSRLTRDMILLRWDRIELGTVIVQAVETTRPLIEERRHKLALDLPPEPIEVEGDLNRLIQIFGNLLSNAAKYTPPGGDISVRAVRHQSEVVVSVRDSGIGIESAHVARIFELFSQVDPKAEASDGGLGIGLALVKGLVERHRGTVVARSDGPGSGSEFVVTLPVASEAGPGQALPATPRREIDDADHSRRVLVVDDNVDAAESMAVVLRLVGYEVRTAHDGEHAIQMAEEYRPHVALLDIGMPGINGYEVARRLRQEPWGRDAILVACTGWGQPEDRRRSQVAGFDDHLVKPVSPEAIVELVATLSSARRS